MRPVPHPDRVERAARPVTAAPAIARSAAPGTVGRLAVAAAAVGVLAQVSYPLLDGEPLRLATIVSVLALAAAALLHATAVRGPAWALAAFAIVGGLGWLAEGVGVATGFPFGTYSYAATLGPQLVGVPVLVPLAWFMLGYPAYLAGQALGGRRWGWLAGAWTLAAWDLFLDPQMVAAGHWTWAEPTPALPGVPGIPLTNYAGWLLTATAMMLALTALGRATGRDREPAPGLLPHDLLPAAVLLWTYASQVMANLVFFGRPAVAGWGAVAMGLTVLPYAALLLRGRRRERRAVA
jgi:putative membrane protein